jgi:hypothetical protein
MSDDRILILARVELQRTDWKLIRTIERFYASAEWCDWRDKMREIASNPNAYAEPLPAEPPFGVLDKPAPEPPPQLLPEPDALMRDYGQVTDDLTGDMLLDAFEHDESETIAVVQTLSALRLKHLSEQLNVERARLDREHQATGVANPRSASIDRLLGLLTRRGEV